MWDGGKKTLGQFHNNSYGKLLDFFPPIICVASSDQFHGLPVPPSGFNRYCTTLWSITAGVDPSLHGMKDEALTRQTQTI